MEHLTDNKICFKEQSRIHRYVPFHSRDKYLSYLTDKTLTDFDSGLLTKMVLIDLGICHHKPRHSIKKMSSVSFSALSIN